jgi:hypothetical protein
MTDTEHSAAAALRVTDLMMEMDDHRSREDRVLAKLRQRAEDYARNPPEKPAMWPVIVIGLAAGVAGLAVGSVFAQFFL